VVLKRRFWKEWKMMGTFLLILTNVLLHYKQLRGGCAEKGGNGWWTTQAFMGMARRQPV
jgi:hypothetical protein